MIFNIDVMKDKSANNYESEIKFEFGFENVVKVVVEIIIVASPLVYKL